VSGIGRRLLSSLRDALSGISQSSQPEASASTGAAALAEQLARARSALAEDRAQEVVDDLETSLDSLVLLLSATAATLGSAYDKLDRGRDRDRVYKQAVRIFRMTSMPPSPAEIVAIVPALDARGERTRAIEALRGVAAAYPDEVSVAHLLATELETAGDPAAALAYADLARRLRTGDATEQVRYLKRATELDSGNAEFRASLGEAMLRAGDVPGAVEELQAAVAKLPEGHQANISLAEAVCKSGRPRDALNVIDPIVAEQGTNVTALLVRAGIHVELGELEAAMADLNSAIDLDTGSMAAQRTQALLLARLGRYEDAITAFDQVLAATPDDRQALMSRGTARYSRRDLDGSEADFAHAAKLAEAAGDDPLMASALSWQGETLRTQGRYTEALRVLDRALAVGPPSAFVLGTKGQVLTMLGRRTEAAEALTAAATADPNLAWVHTALAEVHRLDGRWDQALAELDLASRGGQTAYTYFTRGQVLAAAGRNQEAADQLRSAWRLDPSPGTAEELAGLLALLGKRADLEESLTVIDQALSADPTARSLLAIRADTLRMLGRQSEALVAVDQFLASDDDTNVSGLKALILAELGRAAEALELANAVLDRDPKNVSAQVAKIQALMVRYEYDQALTAVESLVSDTPGESFGIVIKGSILCNTGRYADAVRLLVPLLEKDPDQPLTSALIGYALQRQEPPDWENAAKYLRRATHGEPHEAWYQIELAGTLDELDRPVEARQIRQQVVDRTPTGREVTARGLGFAGWAALFIDRADDAVALLSEAAQLDPDDIALRFALALALLHAGRDELAVDEYGAASSLTKHWKSRDYAVTVLREALSDLRRARRRGRLDAVERSADEAESRLREALEWKES
jgi:tetratricopeptide (TPR) repeat protein